MKPTAPIIKVTTDYSQFKIIDENREIVQRHLKQLMHTIQSKDFLRLFPIIVNSKLQVIEGQHRLRAAEALKIPLYYIIDNDITVMDIAIVNNNRKSWAARDYIGFYAKSGNENYKRLRKLLKDHPWLTIGCAIKLVGPEKHYFVSGGGALRGMKAGQLSAINYNLADQVADICFRLQKDYEYMRHPGVVMAVKGAVMNSTKGVKTCCDLLWEKKHLLPNFLEEQATGSWHFNAILNYNLKTKSIT